MSPYFETIQLLNGELKNLDYHQQRFRRTRAMELGLKHHPLLRDMILVPDGLDRGLYKCRVLYGKEIDCIEYEPYLWKVIQSLKLVYSDTISYGFKYGDRAALKELYRLRGECDDILIVKKGCITDSYFANVVFWNGQDWLTPERPLLPGTMRASLIREGKITEARILPADLTKFLKVKLINAMNDLQTAPEIHINSIRDQGARE